MSLSSWLSLARSRSQPRNPASHPRKARLFLEHLEGRALLASYSAANVAALIADINAANTAGGANTITLTAKTTSPYVLTAVNNSTFGGNDANGLPVIAANDNLTVVGNGDTIERSTATGTPYFRLLAVASGGSLTLENLKLQGGFLNDQGNQNPAIGGGGAISNDGTLVLNGVKVQDNYAESGNGGIGGGIYSLGGSVTLEGGTIVSNNWAGLPGADTNPSSAAVGWGGGLYAQNSTVTVNDATLDNNTTLGAFQSCGGGLYAFNSTVTVTSSTLDNNLAEGDASNARSYGGGLFADQSTVAVTNSTLDNNSVKGVGGTTFGGGLYLGSGTATLSNDTLESNTTNGGTTYGGYGGGLYIDIGGIFGPGGPGSSGIPTTVTLSNDTIEGNSAHDGGGGIYIWSGATAYLDSFTLANTINNTDSSGLNGPTANIVGTYSLQ